MCIMFLHAFIICVYLVLVYNSQSGCRRSDRQSVFCSRTPTDAQRRFHGETSLCLYTHTHRQTALILQKLHTVSSSFLLSLQIACYHKNDSMRTHETVFGVQFHTGTLCGDQLSLQKEDLDHANKGTQSVFGQIFALSVPKVFEDKNLKRYFHLQNNKPNNVYFVSRTNSFIFSDKSIDILFEMLA